MSVQELSYTVTGMSCAALHGGRDRGGRAGQRRQRVEVDLDTKLVVVHGDGVSDDAVREAIREAGYEAA